MTDVVMLTPKPIFIVSDALDDSDVWVSPLA